MTTRAFQPARLRSALSDDVAGGGVRPARGVRPALACLAASSLLLSACQATLDLTVHEQGTYDLTMRMTDDTGTTLTSPDSCSDLVDPSLVAELGEGAQVSARVVDSSKDSVTCDLFITSRPVADSAGDGALVWRDGDRFSVNLTSLANLSTSTTTPSSGSSANSPSAVPGSGAGGSDSEQSGSAGTSGSSNAQPEADSVATDAALLTAELSVTFPGAVIESTGGNVSGRTVTWQSNKDDITELRASGYAAPEQGLSWWQQHATATLAIGAAAVVMLAVATLLATTRRRRSSTEGAEASRDRAVWPQ